MNNFLKIGGSRSFCLQAIQKNRCYLLVSALISALSFFQLELAFAEASASPGDSLQRLHSMNLDVSIERLIQYAAEGDVETMNLLIDAGVSVRASDSVRHVTALHNAAAQGHLRLVVRLVELGADTNALDWNGFSPLIDAAYNGHSSVVAFLLTHGARSDILPRSGPTALLAAIQTGSAKLVEQLLSAGADPRQTDSQGQIPLAAAELANRADIREILGQSLAKDKAPL